ncbi:hypothetical protein [Aureimonas sp. ME7]|uniref:hypothetical protein n=1 Tax=Aureimonas sp. ME7 TaxID=2744252 RepID=UPI0015F7664C|nr:hypothetical protein [Aureimonas sp. ME7]
MSACARAADPAPETFRPRAFAFHGLWRPRGAALKLYSIRAGEGPIDPVLFDDAERVVSGSAPTDAPVGSVVLHRGEEAVWLLLLWWMPGGILAERLWRRPLDGATGFEPVERPLMACVWELSVIGFERDAYVATVMAGGTQNAYLDRTLPEGEY